MSDPPQRKDLPQPSEFTAAAEGRPPVRPGGVPVVDGYEVLELIAEHGQGSVWRAIQLNTKRQVALKFLRFDRFASDSARVRFQREIELAASLDHPHIATVYESGAADGMPYYAMEYVPGVDLEEYVARNAPDRRQIVALVCDIAKAVQHAHQRGVIHRDLKPSNILLTDDGEPHVLDFGLAKAYLEEDSSLAVSQDGDTLGTVHYMSPEQAAGRIGSLDTRTDVYSLGVILFRLVTGDFPHSMEGSSFEVRRRIAETDARRPRQVCGDIDGELEAVLIKALARDPDQRYAAAGDLARDIENYLHGDPLLARPVNGLYFLRLWVRKHRLRLSIAAAVALAMLTLGVYAYVRVAEERDRAEVAADASTRSLYFDRVHLAQLRYEDGDIAEVRRLLGLCPEPLRGWEWHHLWHIHDQAERTVSAHAGGAFLAVVSPDGNSILSCGKDGAARLWDARTLRPLGAFVGHRGDVLSAAFSPDGNRAVTAGEDGTVRMWLTSGGDPLWTVTASERWVEAVAFCADGVHLAYAARDGAVTLCLAKNGKPVHISTDHHGHPVCVAFSPDGRLLASGGTDGRILVREVASPTQSKELAGHEGTVWSLAFAPDGSLLVSASEDRTVRLWDLAAMRERKMLRGHTHAVTSAAFSPDGKTIVSGGWDRTIRLWDAKTGMDRGVLRGHEGYISCLAVLPAGGRMVSAALDGTLKVWTAQHRRPWSLVATGVGNRSAAMFTPDGKGIVLAGWLTGAVLLDAATGREVRGFVPASDEGRKQPGIFALAVDPRGRWMASAGVDGHVRLWSLADGTELCDLAGHEGSVLSVASCPAGERIVSGGKDATVRIWNTRAKSCEQTLAGFGDWVYAVDVHPEGQTAAAGCGDGSIRLFRVGTGQTLRAFQGHNAAVHCLAFSPNGDWLASGGADALVKLWPTRGRGEPLVLAGHSRPVNSLAFSPDGRRLVSTSDEGALRLWDSLTGAQALALSRPGETLWSARFSPDGRTIVVTSDADAGTVRRWHTSGP